MCKKTTINEFITKAKLIHGKKYDYSDSKYINSYTKINIICHIHGTFQQTPSSHIHKKRGCSKCNGGLKLTINEFIYKANLIHENKYDYSLVNYVNAKTNINIICPIHGTFQQIPDSHITQKTGCSKCSLKYNYKNIDFINKANLVHNNRYDYTKLNYKNNYTNINIICKKHGVFSQTPSNHLTGKGCEKCSVPKNENLIQMFLENKKINFINQHRFDDCKNIKVLPFDFYLPELNTCIEFNGKQHYFPIDFFGGVKEFKKQQKRDEIKINYCKNKKINLIIIKFNDNISEILSNLFN